jgi:hypothetical protein
MNHGMRNGNGHSHKHLIYNKSMYHNLIQYINTWEIKYKIDLNVEKLDQNSGYLKPNFQIIMRILVYKALATWTLSYGSEDGKGEFHGQASPTFLFARTYLYPFYALILNLSPLPSRGLTPH